MRVIYENTYGCVYFMNKSPNPYCQFQLIVDSVGVYMSKTDIEYLLKIVLEPNPLYDHSEYDAENDNICCKNDLVDLRLKTDGEKLRQLEELLSGTLFSIKMMQYLKGQNITINTI